ncbi:MAG: SDR family oxidoreductase, partial [Geminicoccaceae bacterium]
MTENASGCPVDHSSFSSDAEKRIVAVTGASRGIGHAIVKTFHENGWEVLTLARTPFSSVCPWAEGIVRHIEADLSDEASVEDSILRLKERLGDRGLNALVNNAGISPKGESGSRLGATNTTADVMHQV